MLAQHQAVFWGDKELPQIYAYQLTATLPNAPQVQVLASFDTHHIHLSYFIEHANWLTLPSNAAHSHRQDYLWEQNCLECFVEFKDRTDYLEMNFSPNELGNGYNLYHFDDYRTPNIIPPQRADGHLISIIDGGKPGYHSHHLSIVMPDDFDCTKISKINPCVILYQDNQPCFYAVQHASPPDFHDKAFWQAVSSI